jgi:hypothetical protein
MHVVAFTVKEKTSARHGRLEKHARHYLKQLEITCVTPF